MFLNFSFQKKFNNLFQEMNYGEMSMKKPADFSAGEKKVPAGIYPNTVNR